MVTGQSTFSSRLVTPSFQLVFVATAVENRRKTIIVITKAFVSFSMSLLLCRGRGDICLVVSIGLAVHLILLESFICQTIVVIVAGRAPRKEQCPFFMVQDDLSTGFVDGSRSLLTCWNLARTSSGRKWEGKIGRSC